MVGALYAREYLKKLQPTLILLPMYAILVR